MKRYIMLLSLYAGLVVASDGQSIQLKNYKIRNDSDLEWVETFKQNPQGYLEQDPDNSLVFFSRLQEKYPTLDEKKYLLGKRKIINHYVSCLKDVKKEYGRTTEHEKFGNFLLAAEALAAHCLAQSLEKMCQANIEPGYLNTGCSYLWGIFGGPIPLGCSLLVTGAVLTAVAHKKSVNKGLHNRLRERGENFMAMYEIVKSSKDKRIWW